MNRNRSNVFSRLASVSILGIFAISTGLGNAVSAFAKADTAPAKDSISFVGIKKSKTAAILDTFNENQKNLLFNTSPFTQEEEQGLFESEGNIKNLEQMMDRLQTAKDSLKEQKMEVTSQKFTLQSMLQELDVNIDKNTSQINDAEEAINAKNKQIVDLLRNILELQNRIDSNKESILKYLSYIYSKGDKVYGDQNSVDIIRTLVFTEGNVSDVLENYHFLTVLEVAGQNFLEERRSLLGQYYVQTQSLKDERVQLVEIKKSLAEHQASLEEQKAYKQELLEQTRGQEALFNQYIQDRQEKQDTIESRLADATRLYDGAFITIAERSGCKVDPEGGVSSIKNDKKAACDEIAKSYENEKKLREYEVDELGPNPFDWPVQPKYISAYYHDSDYFDSVGSQHEGVDIPTDQGTEIKAPMAGYVYFVNEPTKNGYGYLALKHPNGLMTVYGHVSEILVSKYNFVEKGTVIALSGGAPGTPGAGVMSSGPHLHFEVWQGKETVDALRFLDLTKLRYESLSSKYKYKFIEDLKLRYGYMANTQKYDTFNIKGDTEIDRQKYLLATYAAPDFKKWDVWTEESVEAKVDPSFMMCVGLAETGLWRNLKTAYNVGNIGNTDSGETSQFISARDGIYWMGKTFNNKFLGDYQKVSDLSRWGNKDKAIYASSSKNWHENVIRCLSALKGRFVEDDYSFRLAPVDSTVAAIDRKNAEEVRTPNNVSKLPSGQ